MTKSRNLNKNDLQQTRPLTLSSAFLAFAAFLDMLSRIAQERVPTIDYAGSRRSASLPSHCFLL